MKKDKGMFKVVSQSLLFSALVIGMVCMMVLMMNMNMTQIIESHGQRGWRDIVSAATGGGPLGADESGFQYFMTVPHEANGITGFASNFTNASSYEHTFYLDQEMDGETPYSTAFDFLGKIRVNDTVGFNTSGNSWETDWIVAYITVDFQYASDVSNTTMSEVLITNTTSFAWYHVWINNSGSGYQIAKGETFNVTQYRARGYW